MLGLWGLLAAGQTGRIRFAAVAGVGLGIALLAKASNGPTWLLFLAYGGWLASQMRKRAVGNAQLATFALALVLPLLVAGAVQIAYNVVRTGHWLDTGYTPGETFSTPLWYGLAGLLLSPGKSLFVYSPILIAALAGIPALVRRDRAVALLSLTVAAYFPLLYARWFMWWGGSCWGPRFLLPSLPFLCLFLAPVVDWVLRPKRHWARWLLAVIGALSLCVQILGVGVDFNRYFAVLYQRGIEHWEVIFRTDLSPVRGHWALLRAGEWDVAWARDRAGAIDWPRLIWPLLLLTGTDVAWRVHSQLGRRGLRLLLAAEAGLLMVAMWVLVRQPAPVDEVQWGSQALSETLEKAARHGDVLIVDLRAYSTPLQLATALMERYRASPAYWGWLRQEPVSEERQALLAALGERYRGLWLALEYTSEGDWTSTTERWLDDHAYRVGSQWLGPAVRLVQYQLPSGPLDEAPDVRLDLWLGQDLRVQGFSLAGPSELCAGRILPVSLFWQAQRRVKEDYVVTVQLLDEHGRLVAQTDRPPLGGFRPTSSWLPGEVIRDNYGLALPRDLLAGRYHLVAGMYLPPTMQRLAVRTAGGVEAGDHVPLADVTVVGAGCR